MKKAAIFISLSLLTPFSSLAIDLEKPPKFKRSAEELERVKKQKVLDAAADKQQAEKAQDDASLYLPDGHDPRDHDHDHDDAEDLDHSHDDPLAHEKQLEILEQKGIKDESSWWPF